jgi:hypothetical protein
MSEGFFPEGLFDGTKKCHEEGFYRLKYRRFFDESDNLCYDDEARMPYVSGKSAQIGRGASGIVYTETIMEGHLESEGGYYTKVRVVGECYATELD